MHTIFYIDEEPGEVRRFKRFLAGEFKIDNEDFSKKVSFNKLFAKLRKREFDFLIVDYHLNDKSDCGFNGDKVVVYFQREFPNFPLILLTSHESKAITQIKDFDLEKIHSKVEFTDRKQKTAFIQRIHRQIEDYQKRQRTSKVKLKNLIKKRSDLSAKEEEELVELDDFLEEALGTDHSIPDHVKHPRNDQKIATLLKKTDLLISKIKEYEKIQK